ncbi:unnamed protein product [Blepharisma stoltei]|uniref:Uncharacterized protein n=1 Tax=Blepharisma stoltei TaxID=1481888 RepID=A0AAU9JXK6_9CILI|nr:unnamed protein product [Blepharisma stoltei]
MLPIAARSFSKTTKICDLSWLFKADKLSPSFIKAVDSMPEYKLELENFSRGFVWKRGDIEFQIFDKNQLQGYREIIAQCFAYHSAFKKYVDFSYEEWRDYVLPELAEQTDFLKFSVAARVKGELAGVLYSMSWASRPQFPVYLKPNSKEVWEKLKNFAQLINKSIPFNFGEPDRSGKLSQGTLDRSSVLYLADVGVLPEFNGKNLSYDLMFLSASLGYLYELRYAMAVSFDVRSSFIQKLGGVSFKPIYFKDCEVEGIKQYPVAVEGEGVSCLFLNMS